MHKKLFVDPVCSGPGQLCSGSLRWTPATTVATEEPLVATEAPATEVQLQNRSRLKIYLLDYTPDTITWLKDEINPAFEAAHPGVTVEITEGSWSGWDTTFSGFFAAGEGPDIINLGSEMNTLYGESLADMDPYLGEAAWPDIANFGPALENATYDGHLRGLADLYRSALCVLPNRPDGSRRLDHRHSQELRRLENICCNKPPRSMPPPIP